MFLSHYIREVNISLCAIRSRCFDFKEALRQNQVNCFRLDKMAAETCQDLTDRFDQRANGDGAHSSSYRRSEKGM